MPVRASPVAASGVELPLAILDCRHLLRSGQRRRGFEVGQGRFVVAKERQDLGERGAEVRDRRMAEPEGRLQVLARFLVGEDRPRFVAGAVMRLRGCLGPAGQGLVVRDERPPDPVRACACRARERIRDPGVEQSAPDHAQAFVGDISKARMREVEALLVGPGGDDLPDEAAPHELLQGLDRLLVAPATGQSHEARVE